MKAITRNGNSLSLVKSFKVSRFSFQFIRCLVNFHHLIDTFVLKTYSLFILLPKLTNQPENNYLKISWKLLFRCRKLNRNFFFGFHENFLQNFLFVSFYLPSIFTNRIGNSKSDFIRSRAHASVRTTILSEEFILWNMCSGYEVVWRYCK